MNIKLLVFDIDGTLIAHKKDTIEKSAVEAISLAKQKGYHVLIATGRCYYFLREEIIDEIDPDLYVTINGTCLVNRKQEILETHTFDRKTMDSMITYVRENELLLGLKYEDYIISPIHAKEYADSYIELESSRILVKDGTLANYNEELLTKNAMGAYLIGDDKDSGDKFLKAVKNVNVKRVKDNTFDIYPCGVDKTKTIESALKHYNLTWQEVMVFGDGENDIEMLSKAQVGVAMGNASKNVKKHADYVTSDITEDGIFNALKYFKII